MPSPNAVFRALADPTRREILQVLRDGPLGSGEIATYFDSAWPTISRHLGVLREAELILAERNGNSIRYELNTTVMQEFMESVFNLIQPGGRNA